MTLEEEKEYLTDQIEKYQGRLEENHKERERLQEQYNKYQEALHYNAKLIKKEFTKK